MSGRSLRDLAWTNWIKVEEIEQGGEEQRRRRCDSRRMGAFTGAHHLVVASAGRGSVGLRPRARAAGVVADPQQQGDERPVREQRGAAVGQERHGQAGERDDPGDAADDDEALQGDGERQAGGEQLAEAVADAERGAQAALDEQDVEHQQREEPDQAELLAEARDDEVGLGEVGEVGAAAAQAGAEQAARRPCP